MEKLEVVSGIALPLFPMRPMTGMRLTETNLPSILNEMGKNYVVHPKLNGDRVLLAVKNGEVRVCQRHGDWYQFAVTNKSKYASLEGTVLDGEVYQKNFYPFDSLAIAGKNLLNTPIEVRLDQTQALCAQIRVPYWFAEPTRDQVLAQRLDTLPSGQPQWEGLVLKKRGSRYRVVGSESHVSEEWVKIKWDGSRALR